ncbi:DUF1963 domain-containing protein [Patulibacter sp. SYSU D01012]|uniref:DUF1963 domain-containing protein n=1 Tax=Patulibacter sp. SYSU D01012 TaxID=2817381 RepID=UPI001B3047BE|nr:DUF1963 domain-containing protein [Patulibacter sp. SYSU D01012]
MHREELAEIVADEALPDAVAAALLRHARPAVLLMADGAPRAVGASKGGGRPDLPVGTPWPTLPGRDHPYVFLLQLRLADLPDLGDLPRAGLLSVSIGWDPDCGELDGAALVRVVPDGEELRPVDPPPALVATEDLEDGLLREMALRPLLTWTLPTATELLRLEPGLPRVRGAFGDETPEGYDLETQEALADGLASGDTLAGPEAQLLGWGHAGAQGEDVEAEIGRAASGYDDEHELARAPWRMLLEIPSAELIPSFGDGGTGWVALPAEDLRAERWDRAFTLGSTG